MSADTRPRLFLEGVHQIDTGKGIPLGQITEFFVLDLKSQQILGVCPKDKDPGKGHDPDHYKTYA